MKNLFCFLCGTIILAGFSSCADNKRGKNYNNLVDESVSAFVKTELEADQAELRSSKLAATNSTNPRVLNFAKMMLADHAVSSDQLEKIAINNRVSGVDSISKDHQKIIADITLLKGKAFDKAYINMMVTEHQNALKLYTTASTDRMDDIQRYAKRNLLLLRTHLDSANNIATALK